MAEQKIELRKIRDFGQVINDTFVFLRQNLKPLLKSFFAICGVFMLGQAVFSALYQSHTLIKVQQQLAGGSTSWTNIGNLYASIFTPLYFLLIIFALLTLVSIKVILGAYFKYYLENDGQEPGIEEIWSIFKRYFFKVFFYNIPAYLVLFGGLMFCVLPGIFFWVVLVPFNMIIMIEDKGFGASFSRCFEIIKDNFWSSFGVYMIAGIIYLMSAWIINTVVGLVFSFTSYFTAGNNREVANIAKSFLSIFSFTFYIVYFIAGALQYFNLAEQKDGTGILNRIDTIGTDKNNFDNIEEQY